MQCYVFELDKDSQDFCTIITPFGKYKYSRPPMGFKCSLDIDIAQDIMENVLSDIKDADVYIDDVGAFSNNWNHHLNLLATFLHCLCKNGFIIIPLECEWAIKKLTGLANGLLLVVKSPGKGKSILCFIWIILAMPQNCAYSLVE